MDRHYGILYRRSTNTYDIIAKDFGEPNWFVYAEGLHEDIARFALAGLEAEQ